MQYTFPNYYKEFSCIAGACPDTCCAGWQIVIDDQTLKKYQHFKGPFRNRLHNDIDWKQHVFRQYNRRCAFLNEENLCDIYTEAGPEMFCRTCRNYPRHIEEFEGLREISLSLSCPEAARILLSQKEKVHFITKEKKTKEEVYDDFDYFLFTALMDTRDMLIDIIQDRAVPMQKRLWKLLAAAHDFQLCVNKNELFKWEEMRKRHEDSGYGDRFCSKIYSRINADNIENSSAASACANTPEQLFKKMWKTVVPEMVRQICMMLRWMQMHCIIEIQIRSLTPEIFIPGRKVNLISLIRTGRFRRNSFLFTGSIPISAVQFMMMKSSPR